MNKKMRRRLIVVTLLIVVIAVVVLAVVGSGSAATSLRVSEAKADRYVGKRVQVSGTVVDGSYSTTPDGLSFDVADDTDATQTLHVDYTGAVPATFGNGVVAISTGKMQSDGSLEADELLTKCPSKYESAEGSLTVANLKECGSSMIGVDTKLAGYIKGGTLVAAGQGDRFTLYSQDAEIAVVFDGALPDDIKDESSVVLSGSLGDDGKFHATSVAAESVGS